MIKEEIKHKEFLDEDGDIIADKVLDLFDDYTYIKENKDVRTKLSGLFYNDIYKIRFGDYSAGASFIDFYISVLPGQCSTLVVHDIALRGTKSYKNFITLINQLAIGLGFSNILITTYKTDETLCKYITEDGFELFKEGYMNKRTGNFINYYIKLLY